jgi:glycosyltransferase involved in cell wall biosynthesis
MDELKGRRVAIVHDWIYGGGAERVVLELHRMFPGAPIYTSYCSDEWRRRLDGKVVTGYLQNWPFNKLRKFLPVLRIFWFMSLKLDNYDLVISSAGNGEAKSVRVRPGATHVCYCHSPTHFYWRHYAQYLREPGFGIFNPLARIGLRVLVGPLRWWDKRSAGFPGHFIANSSHIQSDIKRYYGRESAVVYPPVDIERFQAPEPESRYGFVAVGRQVPYKRLDIIVKACSKLNLPLAVLGNGPEHARLKKLAGPSVSFIKKPDDTEVARYMKHAQAFIFAAHEDFGITPIEAMAAGTPVIAYRAGGALDYVQPGTTGEFFGDQSVKSLMLALKDFDASRYDHAAIARHSAQYSVQEFQQGMIRQLTAAIARPE